MQSSKVMSFVVVLFALVACSQDSTEGEDRDGHAPTAVDTPSEEACAKQTTRSKCEGLYAGTIYLGCVWLAAKTVSRKGASCEVHEELEVCRLRAEQEAYTGACVAPDPPSDYASCPSSHKEVDMFFIYRVLQDGSTQIAQDQCHKRPRGWKVCWDDPEQEPPECECSCLWKTEERKGSPAREE